MIATGSRRLLACGAAAGPIYIVAGLAQALTREGFDMRRHALSLLSNGDRGWIQVANFLVCGVLVIAGAVGVRRASAAGRGRTALPILLALYGVGLIGAGIFKADPAPDFPPGGAAASGMSQTGLLHFVFGGLGFYALIAACFVMVARAAKSGRRGWAAYSAFSGTTFFLTFAGIASGNQSPAMMVAFYAAVAWVWIWLTLLLVQLRTDPIGGQPAGRRL